VIHVIPCAYVHHTNEAEQAVAAAINRLEEHDVYPIGRYGHWDYTSMEDSILSGIETAQRVSC
jgi:UDP-N-acetylmuramyl tripeptide synthase